jgi:hypothetical protein
MNEQQNVSSCHAVILNSDGDITVESFSTVQELAVRLKALIDRDVSVFPFVGQRLFISKPPMRYLMTPDGNVPLFDINAEQLEPDDTGYLGIDPIHFEGPPQIKMQAPKQVDTADEFFDDKNDETFGVFDSVLPDPDS